ncbi:MAG: DUF805 domain-containing protein [bacterium]|nr:DUF805 domain-containing protein [Acidimicrobiia bacterium]MCY4650857.1 DUF805 domain-containing protein [bacterium]
MSFPDAIGSVLRQYAVFRGRAARSEYWWWVLAVFIGQVIVGVVGNAIDVPSLGVILSLAVLVPGLAVATRRLHDTGRRGSWLALWIAVFVILGVIMVVSTGALIWGAMLGFGDASLFGEDMMIGGAIGVVVSALGMLPVAIWSIVWLAGKGDDGPNQFGPDPRVASDA